MKHSFQLIHPEKKTSSIRLVVSHKGEKYSKGTGIVIQSAMWNKKAKSLTAKCKDAIARDALLEMDLRLAERERTARTEKDVLSAIDYALGTETPSPSSFSLWDYFKEWSERDVPSIKDRRLAYKRIADIMGTDDDWGDIDGDWVFRFNLRMDALDYSHNYQSTLSAKFRTMMKEAYERGIHGNDSFHLMKASYRPADTIALTQSEVDALWDAHLDGRDAMARDCFIVGVYCAGRFQDYSALSEENLVDGRLRYVQRKTGSTVIIPCSPRIREVFARNGGRSPKITQQELGRRMKAICKAIGGTFADTIEITVTKGGKSYVKKKKRYDCIAGHTARRTGASILYKSGVPIRVCRFLTGHHSDSQFLAYVKCSAEEGADILAKSDFFK